MSTLIPPLARYRVAAIQYESTFGEKEKNVVDLLRLVEEAARHDARLIVLPEMATTGYCWISREEVAPFVEPVPGPTTARFQEVAARYGCYIALGLPEIDPDTDAYYNSVALVSPEGVIGTYRKIHSYIAEPRWARDGDLGLPVWETPLGRMSALVCMDAAYFEAVRIPALHQADVLMLLTNWDEEQCPSGRWMARAFENGVYVVATNRYGRERGVQFSGGSCVLNPDGSIQVYLDNGGGIAYGEIDLERCRDKQWREGNEVIGDRLADRLPAEYQTLVNNTYLWEPLRYHSLYALGELPPGQLSCVGIVELDLDTFPAISEQHSASDTIEQLYHLLGRMLQENTPARPDVLVLPELFLPGPLPPVLRGGNPSPKEIANFYRQHAVSTRGEEVEGLVSIAREYQVSLVVGIAERADDTWYNTVLLLDPEGVYGIYRKLHLTRRDQLWATPGNLGLPTFDTPSGRIGLVTGYDVLFPETVRVLAGKGTDLVCAPTLLGIPHSFGLPPTTIPHLKPVAPPEYNPTHFLIWRVRAIEHNVYLALANWNGQHSGISANGLSGIFPPTHGNYPWPEVIADDGEPGLLMMTIDTREQRTGRRTTHVLGYSPGDMVGSLTGELAYDIFDGIPGNAVRSKPYLRKRQPFWYLDLIKRPQKP